MIDRLGKVRELEMDLNAEIVEHEERGHYEIVPGSDYGSGPCSFDKVWDEEYIVDSPEIRSPDYAKRRAAEARLGEIWNSPDEGPVARYAAAKALGERVDKIPFYDVLMNVDNWIDKNSDNIGALGLGIAFNGAAFGLIYIAAKFRLFG